jgi:hypothetical protein
VLIERAKGVLMLRYGIDADVADMVLASWSRQCGVPSAGLAGLLLRAVCQGAPVGPAERDLVRWLEERLRRIPDVIAPRSIPDGTPDG